MTFSAHEIIAEESINDGEQIKYSSFRETYKIITFAMGIGMIYPNPKTAKRRIISIFILLLSMVPISAMILLDIYQSCLRRDITTVIRHCTIVGPCMGIFFKMFMLFYKRNTAKKIIDEIDNDYAMYNYIPSSYKNIVNSNLKNSIRYTEKYWAVSISICVLCFPAMTILQNLYNIVLKSEPRLYMIHDLPKPFSEPEARFESPFYEIMFVYTCYTAMFYIVNFTGFDGFFGLCINHACLKMDLYVKVFTDAMKIKDKKERQNKILKVIRDQNGTFKYVNLIQDTFNIWLGVVLMATMIQICNCMYQITEGTEFDAKYIIFVLGTILQIYLPCRYSSKLKDTSVETATALYCSGWENVYDISARRTLLIMIMRAQKQLEITAFNLLVFDMNLFVSILRTSYSMYTLLRS